MSLHRNCQNHTYDLNVIQFLYMPKKVQNMLSEKDEKSRVWEFVRSDAWTVPRHHCAAVTATASGPARLCWSARCTRTTCLPRHRAARPVCSASSVTSRWSIIPRRPARLWIIPWRWLHRWNTTASTAVGWSVNVAVPRIITLWSRSLRCTMCRHWCLSIRPHCHVSDVSVTSIGLMMTMDCP